MKAQISFTDIAPTENVIHKYGIGDFGGGLSTIDFNNDGWDDLVFTTENGQGLQFYENGPSGFSLVNSSPITNTEESKMVLWADYDNDGDLDFFLATLYGQNYLFNNNGSFQFTDVTAAAGLPTDIVPTYGGCFGDYDLDGNIDLYITNYNDPLLGNFLYRNKGDGSFEDVTVASNTRDFGKAPFGASFFDYNNDGYPDLYVYQDKYLGNTLLRNNGDGTFSDVSVASGAGLALDAMCSAIGDYDNNGFLDIYITNTQLGNAILLNNGDGTFLNDTAATGTSMYGIGWGSTFVDIDLDMDMDLYVCTMVGMGPGMPDNVFYQNNGNGTFSEPGFPGLEGDTLTKFSSALADFNNDGFPDLAVARYGNDSSALFQSSGNSNHWLKVNLTGTISNRDAIGSRLEFYTNNGFKQIRETHCGTGFLAQDSKSTFVGFGSNTLVDSIIIRWPSGQVDKLFNVAVDQTLNLTESGGAAFGVELLSFTGQQSGSAVLLDWTTAQEENVRWMTVERKGQGEIVFQQIGQLAAQNQPASYQFIDEKPLAGLQSYRLKTTDLDGGIEYSSQIEIRFESGAGLAVRFDNMSNQLRLQSAEVGLANLKLWTPTGQSIGQWNWEHMGNEITIPMNELSAGLYLYTVRIGKNVHTGKLLAMP